MKEFGLAGKEVTKYGLILTCVGLRVHIPLSLFVFFLSLSLFLLLSVSLFFPDVSKSREKNG